MTNLRKRRRDNESGAAKDRGAAMVEFAIAIPIFIALLALIFDAGLGYSEARSSSSVTRTAARIGALAGDDRNADFLVLDSLRAQFGDGAGVEQIVIYRSDVSNPTGLVPANCVGAGLCNVYTGATLATLNETDFASNFVGGVEFCQAGAPDSNWCPLGRRTTIPTFLGVFVKSTADATVGIGASEFDLEDHSVFAMYFPPEPVVVTTP